MEPTAKLRERSGSEIRAMTLARAKHRAGGCRRALVVTALAAICAIVHPIFGQTVSLLSSDGVVSNGDQVLAVDALSTPTLRGEKISLGLVADGNTSIATSFNNGFEVLSAVGGQAPGAAGGVLFESLGNPLVSSLGHVAFLGFLNAAPDQNSGIWAGMDTIQNLIAREGHQAPDTEAAAMFSTLKTPVLNNAGEVAFVGFLRPGTGNVTQNNDGGIWAGPAGSLVLIAREGDHAPGTPNGVAFSSVWGSPAMNNPGQVAFRNALIPGIGGTTLLDDEGLWVGTAGSLTLLGREGFQAPGLSAGISFSRSGPTTLFSNPDVNDAGQVTFTGWFKGIGVDDTNNHAIWAGLPGALQIAVRAGDAAAGTSSTFSRLFTPSINAAGQIVFRGILTTGGNVTGNNDRGIWSGLPGAFDLVAREGDQAPAAGTVFGSLSTPSTNALGHVAFEGILATGSGGVTGTNDSGLWIADQTGSEVLQIVREGQPLNGSTIVEIDFAGGSGGQDGRRSGLNDEGQVAYTAHLANGVDLLQLFTPTLHWRPLTDGSWDNRFNWTLGTRPSAVHDVLIDPIVPATVQGPIALTTFINSLVVGGAGAAARLNVYGGDIAVGTTLVIGGDGTVDLNTGSLQVEGPATNQGKLLIASGASLKVDGGLSNPGLIDLNGGQVTGDSLVTNMVDGIIQGGSGVAAMLVNAGGLIHATGTQMDLAQFDGGNLEGGTLRIAVGSEMAVQASPDFWNNFATVLLDGAGATLSGDQVVNWGLIEGAGEIAAAADNRGMVRALGGALEMTGSAVANAPGAELIVMQGATLRVHNSFSNDGMVTLNGGTFDHLSNVTQNLFNFEGHGQFIGNEWINDGLIHFSGGMSTIQGKVINTVNGQLKVTSATATFSEHVTSQGIIENDGGVLYFLGGLTLDNLLTTDPAQTFFSDLIVNASGYIQADASDQFWISGDFINASLMNTMWETSTATLIFHNSPDHAVDVVGIDFGPLGNGYDENFSWGTLQLASGTGLTLAAGPVLGQDTQILLDESSEFPEIFSGKALYVTDLLLADGVEQIASIISDGTVIYYDPDSEANTYLGAGIYPLEGGGFVAPIGIFNSLPTVPIPTALGEGLVLLGLGAAIRWLRIQRYR